MTRESASAKLPIVTARVDGYCAGRGVEMADRFHHLILFDDAGFGGSHKHVFRSIAHLDDFTGTSAFAVLSDTWQLFRDSQFQGAYGSVFAPRVGGYAWVEDYDVDNDSISSVRLTGEEARQVPHAILFAKSNFGGDHKHVFGTYMASDNWMHTKSVAVLAGTWRFDLAGGSFVNLVPGTYADVSPLFVAPIYALVVVDVTTPNPGIAHLILFDDAGFKGGHRHVFEDQADLGDWDGRVSAIAVEHGGWQVFAATNEFHKQGCGGIWGTAGIAVDDQERMYVVSGNGRFDGVENFADSVLKLVDLRAVFESYTARDWQKMFDNDQDLGSCSAVLLPPIALSQDVTGAAPATVNVVATGAKDGRVYLLDADVLGGVGGALWRQKIFSAGQNLYTDGIGITPAFFDAGARGKFLYYCSASDSPHRGMVAIQFDHLEGEGHFGVRAIQFEGPRFNGAPGAPFVSSNGAADGIVWTVDSFRQESDDGEDSVLRAWDAVTGELLYSSPQTTAQKLGNGRKFSSIAVLQGKVLVGAASIACYGLKREDRSAAPEVS